MLPLTGLGSINCRGYKHEVPPGLFEPAFGVRFPLRPLFLNSEPLDDEAPSPALLLPACTSDDSTPGLRAEARTAEARAVEAADAARRAAGDEQRLERLRALLARRAAGGDGAQRRRRGRLGRGL